ncbi:hypothetical protein MG293_004552 [Ovis ammon polii]|uniref:Contactin-associated protein-like 5 n=1 Tax=Ovis ammon polii TaxID=230172 RepID=A0AAD4YF63_OVIAM|nr:hypothetical protein MG293_004552 [Ovis ammon polii]
MSLLNAKSSDRPSPPVNSDASLFHRGTFAGNMNADSVMHHKLLHSVRARFIRFVPLEWNPSGKIGMRVEVYGCSYKSDVADFDGRSSLLYRFNQKLMSTLKDVISLKFKSMQGDGVLFHGEGQRGDHITLELQRGRLALHLNLVLFIHLLEQTSLKSSLGARGPAEVPAASSSRGEARGPGPVGGGREPGRGSDGSRGEGGRRQPHGAQDRRPKLLRTWAQSRATAPAARAMKMVAPWTRFYSKSCCLCCPVRTGTILLGVWYLILNAVVLLILLSALADPDHYHFSSSELGDDSKPRLSSSPPSATLGSLLDDQHWHSVLLERVGKHVNFTVDRHTQHFRTKGEADALDIDYELSFGGIPVPGKPGTFLKKNFHGCIENLYYNGVNIIDLAKRRKHQIYTVGNVTFSCSEPQIVPITFVNSSSSYLLLPGTPQIDGLSVSFQFRTWNKDGLLLSTMLSEGSGTLLLRLEDGTLRLVIQKMTERAAEILTGRDLNDGLWHSVSISARRNRITLTLDNNAASPAQDTSRMQIYSGNRYYFGGCPDNLTDSQCLNPIKAFQGCMRLIFIDNQPKDLISVQQGSLGNFSDLHIDLCSIKDRCLPNYCEHGGSCSQSWTTFYCNCTDTGYAGATCHNFSFGDFNCDGIVEHALKLEDNFRPGVKVQDGNFVTSGMKPTQIFPSCCFSLPL